MKRLLLLIPVALIAGFFWWQAHRPPADYWQGYAEADYVRVGPTLAGKLISVDVARGDQLRAGALLFTQDPVDDQAARDQAAAALHQAQSQLANLQAASKPTEIDAAEADMRDAAATASRARRDLARVAALVPSGASTRQELDLMQQTSRSAQAKLTAATARRDEARAPMGRQAEIEAASRAVAMSDAALAQADWRLAQRRMVAPHGARVADVYARAGETMGAGAPVVELLPPENILVRFFVPEPQLGRVHVGDAVRMNCDGCAAPVNGTITFIAPQAEYTPPVIYSNDTTSKLVFLVEAHPAPAEATRLNPGQPVTVRRPPP
jgi:HlyD family secretion protein